MRKVFLVALFLLVGLYLSAQEGAEKKEGKSGWNFGVLPAVSFDADLGFQYGGLVNLYNYGDGSRFPLYDHSLYFEVSRYTRGSGIYRFYYDSDRLLGRVRLTVDVTYMPEQAYDFYGFNGYESVYNSGWEDERSPDYRSRMFRSEEHTSELQSRPQLVW